jgi:hypothetical protein
MKPFEYLYNDDDDDEWSEEDTDYDFEALKCLKKVLKGLLLYNPNERLTAQQALSIIE